VRIRREVGLLLHPPARSTSQTTGPWTHGPERLLTGNQRTWSGACYVGPEYFCRRTWRGVPLLAWKHGDANRRAVGSFCRRTWRGVPLLAWKHGDANRRSEKYPPAVPTVELGEGVGLNYLREIPTVELGGGEALLMQRHDDVNGNDGGRRDAEVPFPYDHLRTGEDAREASATCGRSLPWDSAGA
ncbi:MAG: hypothetical protein BJ554DRAFT_5922, partial [Olpidium bornovanus]